jgi:hypothetical protein
MEDDGMAQFTCYLWRKGLGGLKTDQVRRRNELEKENARLRKVVSGLKEEKLITRDAASRTEGARQRNL